MVEICISICLLVLSICILINVKKICNPSVEHMDVEDRLKQIEGKLNTLAHSKPSQLVLKKTNYIAQDYKNIPGQYLASGPLINGVGNMVVTRSASKGNYIAPYMISKPAFMKPYHIWYYNKDGTIRNKWDSINNQMGSCLYKTNLTNTDGKCSDSKYKSSRECVKHKKIWYETVGLTKNHSNCDKWSWDSYGRLTHNRKGHGGSGYKKCLIPLKTKSKQTILGLSTCQDNNIQSKELWSFH